MRWHKRLLFRVRVSGESAYPKLMPGRVYLASGILPIRVGDFVVFQNPRSPAEQWIKRVKVVREDGYEVEGLVSWSTPSEAIGIVPRERVWGRLI